MRSALRHQLAVCLLLAVAAPALADQYRSQAREASSVPRKQQSAQQMLKQTTDPYARALLLRSLAGSAAQKHDYAAAASYLQQALDQHGLSGPAADEMRRQLVALRSASGDPKAVINALEPAYRRNPDLPSDQLAALGAAYAAAKRYTDAVPLLERATRAGDTPATWLKALVAAEIGAGRDAQAIDALQRLLALTPADGADWLRLAGLQLRSGARDDALTTLELAARLGDINSAEQRLQLITLTAQLGAPFEAGSMMQRWLQGGELPKTADNWKTLGTLWAQARERLLAITAYQQAEKLAPATDLLLQIGQLNMDLQRYGPASEALQQAVDRGSRSAPALLNLGLAYFQQGRLEQAAAAFKRAAALPAGRSLATQWLAFLQSDAAHQQARIARAAPPPVMLAPAALADTPDTHPVHLTADDDRAVESSAATAPSPAEVRTAGGDAGSDALTPVGAQRAGSADGTVPRWNGGITRADWPAGFKPGERLKDPYPNDKPLYTVTAANAERYAKYLAPGYQALFKAFPDYKMEVYPSRRTVSYPAAIYRATQANIGKARLLGSDALSGARLGFPFPHPANGVQAMWNHRLRYRGDSVKMQSTQAVVMPNGERDVLHQTELVDARYANLKDPVDIDRDNILLYYLTWFGREVGSVDFLALVHETANSLKKPRAVWVMPPHINKMFRIPPVGYDQPFPGSDGLYFIDMVDMYNGPFDRYVWKLTGKRELLIPYNDYRISDGRYRYSQLLTPHHFNQNAVRYEMHRVWVVEATARQGTTHAFGKRVFYIDEDSWNVVLVENYDHDDHLWRFQEGHLLPLYDIQAANCIPVVTYDLKDGRYFANRLIGEDPPIDYHLQFKAEDFLPSTVRARYGH